MFQGISNPPWNCSDLCKSPTKYWFSIFTPTFIFEKCLWYFYFHFLFLFLFSGVSLSLYVWIPPWCPQTWNIPAEQFQSVQKTTGHIRVPTVSTLWYRGNYSLGSAVYIYISLKLCFSLPWLQATYKSYKLQGHLKFWLKVQVRLWRNELFVTKWLYI